MSNNVTGEKRKRDDDPSDNPPEKKDELPHSHLLMFS